MRHDQRTQVMQVRLHALRRHAMDIDEFVVVAIDETSVDVQHICKTAGHARTEIHAGASEYDHDAVSHVLAAMVASTLDDGSRAGIPHRKAFTRSPGGKQLASGSAIQAGVSDDRRLPRDIAGALGRSNRDAAARHALTDVVVRIANEIQVQAGHVPGAETLSRRACELDVDRRVAHALVAVQSCYLTRQASADRTVIVADLEAEAPAGLVSNRIPSSIEHRLRKFALVEGLVTQFRTESRHIRGKTRIGDDGRQIKPRLPGCPPLLQFDEIRPSDQFVERADSELCHAFPNLFGYEAEEIDDHVGQTGKVLASQHVVLRCYAGRASIEVANTQVLAAQRDHRCRTEAEAFRAEHGSFDDVQAGLEPAVGLQPHLVTHAIHAQHLVCFRQSQLPGAAGVFHRTERAGAGAPVVPRDRNQVRVCLHHAGRDGAHAGFGHELHGYERVRIDLLEIEDQLRQILDRINVVMRRR